MRLSENSMVRKILKIVFLLSASTGLLVVSPGCGGGDPADTHESRVINIVKEHVKNHQEAMKLEWIKDYPPAAKTWEVPKNKEFSHECYVRVYGVKIRTKDGDPFRKSGLYILGKSRETGKWIVTSGGKPINVQDESL